MSEIEKKEYFKTYIENISQKEQKVMMFSLCAFFELLKYQKDIIGNDIVWQCYIQALKQEIDARLKELLECQK